jgi:GNAT superfamily N-acetyltransferase
MAEPETRPFFLRAGKEADHHYVLSTWRRAEAEGRADIEHGRFLPWQQRYMADILARPNTRIIVASLRYDDSIAGYAVINDSPGSMGIYFVYVDKDARRIGIATMLLSRFGQNERVYYCARPARVKDAQGHWTIQDWFHAKVPRQWRYLERMGYYPLEVTT